MTFFLQKAHFLPLLLYHDLFDFSHDNDDGKRAHIEDSTNNTHHTKHTHAVSFVRIGC